MRGILFRVKHQTGESEDGDAHEDDQQAEFFVGLLQRVQEALKSGEVADQLEDTQNSHHAHQPHYLARLAQNVQVLQALHQRRDDVRQNGQEVDKVHDLKEEFDLVG